MNGLKLIRTISNYSQANLAEKLGVTRQAVNMWEHSRKPILESRRAEICELLGVKNPEWLDEIDEETMNLIRTHKLYKKVEDGIEHFHFSPTDYKYGKYYLYINNNEDFTVDDRCEMKRMKFKKLLSEITDYIESERSEIRNSMGRIVRFNHADKIVGDVFEAWRTAMEKRPELKMVYVYAIFSALDAVSISFDLITEEDYLSSANPSGDFYDTRDLTITMSKQIREYLDFAVNGIGKVDRKAMREALEKRIAEDPDVTD